MSPQRTVMCTQDDLMVPMSGMMSLVMTRAPVAAITNAKKIVYIMRSPPECRLRVNCPKIESCKIDIPHMPFIIRASRRSENVLSHRSRPLRTYTNNSIKSKQTINIQAVSMRFHTLRRNKNPKAYSFKKSSTSINAPIKYITM